MTLMRKNLALALAVFLGGGGWLQMVVSTRIVGSVTLPHSVLASPSVGFGMAASMRG